MMESLQCNISQSPRNKSSIIAYECVVDGKKVSGCFSLSDFHKKMRNPTWEDIQKRIEREVGVTDRYDQLLEIAKGMS